MMLSDLPRDVAEEVLCRLPVTSLRGVRFTCKNLNALTNDRRFTKKHIGEAKKKQRKEFQVVMTLDYRVCLFSVNLNLLCPSIEPVAKLISLDLADQVDISRIFHCHGVLLCITKDFSSLVVWNPCSGQTRWIQPRDYFNAQDNYALGYERKTKYHKVLRFLYTIDLTSFRSVCEFEIYSFNSNTWKVLDVNPEWQILPYHSGLSLKGNTYWYAHEKRPDTFDLPDFLLCFDFTTERFGPRLPLPFHAPFGNTVSLSSVREKQLAVLFQRPASPTLELQIWISSKIEPDALSWNKVFLKVDMKPLTRFPFFRCNGSFFVDENKKVAAVLDRSKAKPFHDIVYIIGKKGYFKKVDLGQARQPTCWPRMCSYVPSSMQI